MGGGAESARGAVERRSSTPAARSRVGGIGPDGAADRTVFVLTPDSNTGELGEWQTTEQTKLDLALPEPRAGTAVVAATDGLLLVGETNGPTQVDTVWKTTFDLKGVPMVTGDHAP